MRIPELICLLSSPWKSITEHKNTIKKKYKRDAWVCKIGSHASAGRPMPNMSRHRLCHLWQYRELQNLASFFFPAPPLPYRQNDQISIVCFPSASFDRSFVKQNAAFLYLCLWFSSHLHIKWRLNRILPESDRWLVSMAKQLSPLTHPLLQLNLLTRTDKAITIRCKQMTRKLLFWLRRFGNR